MIVGGRGKNGQGGGLDKGGGGTNTTRYVKVKQKKNRGWGGGRKQVSKRSTHARPGMHMQQCPAVP